MKSLKAKLAVFFLIIGLLPLLSVGIYSYLKSSSALEKEAVDKLVAVRDIKGSAIKSYFATIRDQMLTFTETVSIKEAMISFSRDFKNYESEINISPEAYNSYKAKVKSFYKNEFGSKYNKENAEGIETSKLVNGLSKKEIIFQYQYIADNPNPLGSKEVLDFADDQTSYAETHKKHHPSIRSFLNKFGYYDIFLLDINNGHIVYSVFKELDYATSLLTGPYKNTNFAEAFKKAKGLSKPGEFILVDYKKYTPSYEAPASFIASPIWDNGKKIGVAIFQMPIDRLNSIMEERSGMGDTGETYLVGQDRLLRSNSFLDKENLDVVSSFKNPKATALNSKGVDLALDGKAGSLLTKNYLGQNVISAYTPINILGLKWGLIAEVNSREAFSAISSIRNTVLTVLVLSIVGILVLTFSFSGKLSKQISEVATKLLDRTNLVDKGSDEIFNNSLNLAEATSEQLTSLQTTVSAIDEISSMVSNNADSAKNSAEVSDHSNKAANKGKETIESMIGSIKEISDSNGKIAKEMKSNNEEITKIVDMISEIGIKTQVINDIVFQTKLLSFNASVEAARAGEHGKGFAVVAEEVGSLAEMSGKAALEITEMLDSSIKKVTDIVEETTKKVDSLVSDSKDKVESGINVANDCGAALDEILENVNKVNEMVGQISTASSEQSYGVQEVTKSIQDLDQTAQQNAIAAEQSKEKALRLKNQAKGLNDVVAELMEVLHGSKLD